MKNVTHTTNPFSTGSSQWMIPLKEFRRPYTSDAILEKERFETSLLTLNHLHDEFPEPVRHLSTSDSLGRSKQEQLWREIHEGVGDPSLDIGVQSDTSNSAHGATTNQNSMIWAFMYIPCTSIR